MPEFNIVSCGIKRPIKKTLAGVIREINGKQEDAADDRGSGPQSFSEAVEFREIGLFFHTEPCLSEVVSELFIYEHLQGHCS
jgi:hypothetical protein